MLNSLKNESPKRCMGVVTVEVEKKISHNKAHEESWVVFLVLELMDFFVFFDGDHLWVKLRVLFCGHSTHSTLANFGHHRFGLFSFSNVCTSILQRL